MSVNPTDRHIPPPAFPPGVRKHPARSARPTDTTGLDAALISPDDPLPKRTAATFTGTRGRPGDDVGVAVGMGLDAHVGPDEITSRGDPYVMEIMESIAKLAEDLRRRGQAGLHATPGMTRFEATLRSYCVGYLAGRRAGGRMEPRLGRALPSDA